MDARRGKQGAEAALLAEEERKTRRKDDFPINIWIKNLQKKSIAPRNHFLFFQNHSFRGVHEKKKKEKLSDFTLTISTSLERFILYSNVPSFISFSLRRLGLYEFRLKINF